ncbi:MAG: hypothetical protein K0R28_7170, partial [Paenibacillus sp.]|nr:hypothetical protein [Paenibacillus sp.]
MVQGEAGSDLITRSRANPPLMYGRGIKMTERSSSFVHKSRLSDRGIRRSGRISATDFSSVKANAERVLQLHRTVGNQAVGRLINGTLQRTLDDTKQSSSEQSSDKPRFYVIPDCKSTEAARNLFSRIALGDSDALQQIGQAAFTTYKDRLQLMEWGLAGKNNEYVVIPGTNGAVNWDGIDDKYDPIAHSHPKQDPGETKQNSSANTWVNHFKNGKPISKNMEMKDWHLSYPTQSDIVIPAEQQATSHLVYTSWQVMEDEKSGGFSVAYNPECTPEKQLVFEIVKPHKTAYTRTKSIMNLNQH